MVAVVVPSPATVGGLACDLLYHDLGAHVLELVLELDLLGDRDAILGGNARSTEGLRNTYATWCTLSAPHRTCGGKLWD